MPDQCKVRERINGKWGSWGPPKSPLTDAECKQRAANSGLRRVGFDYSYVDPPTTSSATTPKNQRKKAKYRSSTKLSSAPAVTSPPAAPPPSPPSVVTESSLASENPLAKPLRLDEAEKSGLKNGFVKVINQGMTVGGTNGDNVITIEELKLATAVIQRYADTYLLHIPAKDRFKVAFDLYNADGAAFEDRDFAADARQMREIAGDLNDMNVPGENKRPGEIKNKLIEKGYRLEVAAVAENYLNIKYSNGLRLENENNITWLSAILVAIAEAARLPEAQQGIILPGVTVGIKRGSEDGDTLAWLKKKEGGDGEFADKREIPDSNVSLGREEHKRRLREKIGKEFTGLSRGGLSEDEAERLIQFVVSKAGKAYYVEYLLEVARGQDANLNLMFKIAKNLPPADRSKFILEHFLVGTLVAAGKTDEAVACWRQIIVPDEKRRALTSLFNLYVSREEYQKVSELVLEMDDQNAQAELIFNPQGGLLAVVPDHGRKISLLKNLLENSKASDALKGKAWLEKAMIHDKSAEFVPALEGYINALKLTTAGKFDKNIAAPIKTIIGKMVFQHGKDWQYAAGISFDKASFDTFTSLKAIVNDKGWRTPFDNEYRQTGTRAGESHKAHKEQGVISTNKDLLDRIERLIKKCSSPSGTTGGGTTQTSTRKKIA